MTVVEGKLDASGMKMAIVAARFNDFIVQRLVGGAMDALVRHGASPKEQTTLWVPGGWEIPLACRRLAQTKRFDAIVAVGCVIRGGTAHFEYVAGEVSKGIAQVGLAEDIPIAMGILTTENLEQAIDRAGAKMGNKGWEATVAAIETVNVLRNIDGA